jgi:hypothetical protein
LNLFDPGTLVFEGKGLRKQVTLYFSKDKNGPQMDLLIYTPAHAEGPVPLLLNLSFTANCQTVADSGIKVGQIWDKNQHLVSAQTGSGNYDFGKIDVMHFLAKGYGFATVYYGDIEPDFPDGRTFGVRSLWLKHGQIERAPDEWGAVAAWAWGLGRAMDYFETDPNINAKKVALTGISRLGKTVLWAAASDQRFAMVIPSCSGEGGAALSRRNYGETIKLITLPQRFAYWFCPNYAKYGDDPNSCPVDAHMLIALMAPRPVLLQTGDTDKWADPKGEFEAAVAAEPVYVLLGKKGLGTNSLPPSGKAIMNDIGYYMHHGGHGMATTDGTNDWDVYLQFMDKHLMN